MKFRAVLLSLVISLSGCVGSQYGLTAKQWQSMSVEQQQLAKQEYQQLVLQKNQFVKHDKGNLLENEAEYFLKRNIRKR